MGRELEDRSPSPRMKTAIVVPANRVQFYRTLFRAGSQTLNVTLKVSSHITKKKKTGGLYAT